MNQPWIYMCSPSRSPLPPPFSCSVLGTQQLLKKACCLIIIYDRVKETYHRDLQLIHDNKKFLHLLDLDSLYCILDVLINLAQSKVYLQTSCKSEILSFKEKMCCSTNHLKEIYNPRMDPPPKSLLRLILHS